MKRTLRSPPRAFTFAVACFAGACVFACGLAFAFGSGFAFASAASATVRTATVGTSTGGTSIVGTSIVGTSIVGTSTVSTATVGSGRLVADARLRGIVRQQGDRMRVAGAAVTAVLKGGANEESFEATTGGDGSFVLELPAGSYRIDVQLYGYYPFRSDETLAPREELELTYFVERGFATPYDVVVRAERPKKEINRRTLSIAEIVHVPGTLGDPVQAVENLPGVARAPAGAGAVIVRGSGPEDTGVYIDGVLVPLIYHFGGLRSVVPADVIERIDFYPGNFSVTYGGATGGILDVRTKHLDPDQVHGALDVSLLDTGLYIEVPISEDIAIAAAARRSYIDLVLKAAIPEDSSVSLIAAPRYYDYQLMAEWRLGRGHEVRAFFFGSSDALGLLLENPADLDLQVQSGNIDTHTFFQRLSLLHRYSGLPFKNELRLALGRDVFRAAAFDQFQFDVASTQFQLRDTGSVALTSEFVLTAGIDAVLLNADVYVRAPRPPREGDAGGNQDLDATLVTEAKDRFIWVGAPFIEAEVTLFGSLKLIPGVRANYFDIVDELGIDPRVVLRYPLDTDWTLKAGAALVHQAPSPQETDETFGNPELELFSAIQTSFGAEFRPTSFLSFDATVFHKDLNHLVSSTGATVERNGQQVPLVYDNRGEGTVLGFELWVQHTLFENFHGWISYTLSRAERVDSGDSEARLFSFDQTHIFGLVAAYAFPENWDLGVRWRYVTGNPYTPFVDGVFLSDFDRYGGVPGPVNSARHTTFHQLDVRLEKRWVYDAWSLVAYLSLVNAYNRGNVEGLQYGYDFRSSEPVRGLPIFPILGIRGEI